MGASILQKKKKRTRLEDATLSLPDDPQHTVAHSGLWEMAWKTPPMFFVSLTPNISVHGNLYHLAPVSTFFIFLTFKSAVFWEEL